MGLVGQSLGLLDWRRVDTWFMKDGFSCGGGGLVSVEMWRRSEKLGWGFREQRRLKLDAAFIVGFVSSLSS